MSKCRECARYDKTKNICCLTKSNILNPNDDRHCVHWLKRRQLLFDRIAASEEVLAKELVYCLNSSSFRGIDSAGRLLAYENEVWVSTILPGSFWTEYEVALAATVARLKEVENG